MILNQMKQRAIIETFFASADTIFKHREKERAFFGAYTLQGF